MRLLLAGCVLLAGLGVAEAQERPSTTTMTCDQAKTLVQQKSAVVLSTGERTFDRFFPSRLFCSVLNEDPVRRTAPTTDNPECPIGYTCTPRPNNRCRPTPSPATGPPGCGIPTAS